jgi:hypothetical protein
LRVYERNFAVNAHKWLLLFALLLATNLALAGKHALAATRGFTLTASNATMPTSGAGSIPFTVTSVDGYSGSFAVGCSPPDVSAKLPACSGGGPALALIYTLSANGVAQGDIPLSAAFCSPSGPCPVKFPRTRTRFPGGLALAGALLVGLGLMRRRARWFTLLVLAVSMLAGVAGITSCAGGKTLTPGVWQYTVTATSIESSPPLISASTTVNVTVPPGVPITYY